MHVFVRDWLSANHVLLRSRDGHVLVDTGYVQHAPITLALIAGHRGLAGEPLAKIVNTHGHSDHVGGNAALALCYGCPIAVPAAEAPLFARLRVLPLVRWAYTPSSPTTAADTRHQASARCRRRSHRRRSVIDSSASRMIPEQPSNHDHATKL